MSSRPISILDIQKMKVCGDRIAALTAYDYTSAQILERAGIPLILVGDTLGMVVLGHDSTLPVTLDVMISHTRAVTRAVNRPLVVADMPFMTYQISPEMAIENAGRLMQEAKCGAVKIEGGLSVAATIARLVACGIPVCGHLGYTPQSTHSLGGPRVQGRSVATAEMLVRDAEALQEAGAFAIVLELVPASLAAEIGQRLTIPVIGIGSGAGCDGEIQVYHDLFGLYTDFVPRHTRRYLELADQITEAARRFAADVSSGKFPGVEQTTDVEPEVLEVLRANLGRRDGSPR